MHAIFSRRFVGSSSSSSSQLIKLLKKQSTLCHRSQIRHFMSLSSSASSASRFDKFYGFFATTLRNTNLKMKLGNLMESRAGFFEFETKGFTGFQKRRWKSWFNGTNGVVFGLIMANATLYTMWRVSDRREHLQWMAKNFVLSTSSFFSGRIHTLITQGFTHFKITYVFMNMLGLYYFGTRIANILGLRSLLVLYLAGTLGGSVFFLSYHALVALLEGHGVVIKNELKPRPVLAGADGSVFAIALLDLFLFPKVTTYIGLILRVPVMVEIILIGYDILQMVEGQRNSFSSKSNKLGGAMVAAIAWKCLRKGRFCY